MPSDFDLKADCLRHSRSKSQILGVRTQLTSSQALVFVPIVRDVEDMCCSWRPLLRRPKQLLPLRQPAGDRNDHEQRSESRQLRIQRPQARTRQQAPTWRTLVLEARDSTRSHTHRLEQCSWEILTSNRLRFRIVFGGFRCAGHRASGNSRLSRRGCHP
jgi:hypothetical protein